MDGQERKPLVRARQRSLYLNAKNNEASKAYGVSVLGYDSASMDYKPADILITTFPTREKARDFAKNSLLRRRFIYVYARSGTTLA
ncbi:MAG: hypothetical protein IJQ01_09965 [Selenomonadaceae bacterium]|nr:hypothetical protein [Selenomonadaceae bacterium]